MWPMCVLTVFSLMNSRAAISLLVSPSASSSRTSASRRVSSSPAFLGSAEADSRGCSGEMRARRASASTSSCRGAGRRARRRSRGLRPQPLGRDTAVAAAREQRVRLAQPRIGGRVGLHQHVEAIRRVAPRTGERGAGGAGALGLRPRAVRERAGAATREGGEQLVGTGELDGVPAHARGLRGVGLRAHAEPQQHRHVQRLGRAPPARSPRARARRRDRARPARAPRPRCRIGVANSPGSPSSMQAGRVRGAPAPARPRRAARAAARRSSAASSRRSR